MALSLPLAVGMIDIEVNVRRFDQGMAYIQARLSRMPSVHNIAVNVSRAQATAQINLMTKQMQTFRQQAAVPVQITVARRGSLLGARGARGGGGGGAGLGMGLLEGLGVARFATNPAMMAGQMLGSGLREAVGTAMELESTFVGLRQVTGESAGNVEKFKKSIFDISKSQAGVSVADVTGIAMAGAKAGISDKEGIAGLETFTRSMAKVKNAVGGGEGLGTEQLTEDMTRMMYLFGKDTGYIESMGSALVRMANISTASAGSIAQMTKALSGTTAALKLSFPETAAFASVLADAGLTAQQGASSFSQIFRSMAAKPETFAGAAGVNVEHWTQMMNKGQLLDGLKLLTDRFKEISASDPTKAQEWLKNLGLVGVRTAGAFQQVATLMDKLGERVAAAKEEEAGLGALLTTDALKAETTTANVQKLSNAFVELADAVGKVALGPLTDSVKTLLTLINGMGKEFGKGGPGGGKTNPLSFMEGIELTGMQMVASMGGAIPESEGFKKRFTELKRRLEESFAAGDQKALEAGPVKAEDLKPGPGGVPTKAQAINQAMADAAVARNLGPGGNLAEPGLDIARENDRLQANLIQAAAKPFGGRAGSTAQIEAASRQLAARTEAERSARAIANARGQDDEARKATKAKLAAAIADRKASEQSLLALRAAPGTAGAAAGLGAAGKAATSHMLDLLGGKAATSPLFDILGQGQGDIGPGLLEKMATGFKWPIPLRSPTDEAAEALAARGVVPKKKVSGIAEKQGIGVAISGEEMLKRFQEEALKGKDDVAEKQLTVLEKIQTGIEALDKKPAPAGGIATLGP